MSALLDSLASAFDGDNARREALDAALREGLPGARNEAWKYTSLRALERRTFAPASRQAMAIDAATLAHVPAPRMVFVNGCFSPGLSDLAALPEGVRLHAIAQTDDPVDMQHRSSTSESVFARLNTALHRDGAVLRVDDGSHVDMPLHLVFVGAAAGTDVAWHVRHRIELGAGARIALVEHHLAASDHAHLGNTLTDIHVAAGARLVHARIQDESPRATLFARTDASLSEASRYQRVDLELGGGLSRHELNMRLEGIDARLSSDGVLLASGRRHIDTRLGIEHFARDTACDLLWRGLASGRSRAAFHGGIVIHPGADGADARLSNKNLLLDDDAEIDTQPVLEIHADEVKAAHGATVGQLDPTAMFYLRSRGLPEGDARRLLTAAFCREVVTRPGMEALRDMLAPALDRALSRIEHA